jgi:outer membrane protein insertion porin family
MKKYIVYFMLFLISFSAFSKNNENVKITEIRVVNNKEIAVEVILNKLDLKVGEDFDTQVMLKDYQKLKKLEYIEDLSIYPQLYDAGVRLVVDIKERENAKDLLKKQGILPLSERETIDKSLVIKSVEVFGNVSVSTSEILESIPVKVGAYFSKTGILEGQKKILDMGYFRDVSPEVLKYDDGIYVKYNVLENQTISGMYWKIKQ